MSLTESERQQFEAELKEIQEDEGNKLIADSVPQEVSWRFRKAADTR